MDGYAVCSKIKATKHLLNIPVIFLTAAYTSSDSLVKGFEAGAVDYITKPVNEQELLARIATHIELYRIRQQMEEQYKRLQRYDEQRQKLLSILAHDIRSPLAGIESLSSALRRESKDLSEFDKKLYLEQIEEAAGNSVQILEDLLTWNQSTAGLLTARQEQLEVGFIVEVVLRETELFNETKNIHIELSIDPSHEVVADERLLRIVLRNLLTNAVKFSSPYETIRITSTSCDDTTTIAVTDYGADMPEVRTAGILHGMPGSTPGTFGEKGTGSGLLICRELMEAQSGSIRVQSKENEGSTFYLTLPAPRPKSGISEPSPSSTQHWQN